MELVSLEVLARVVRCHRRLEVSHHIRDISFGEDSSRIRSQMGLQKMAMLRKLTIPIVAGLITRASPRPGGG
ncbi:hypothetical protein [Nocardiopsis rhodophaea]|uniref:hypothetical protein n=1 Tax=Nocardiopsis rhodophaea TaxID=280238 RepID=UPI0031E28367